MRVRERRSENGAAAVEFAIIFPLFAALVMGMVQYAFYFWTAETTGSAARETARRIVVGSCWAQSDYEDFAEAHGRGITSTSVTPAPGGLDVGDIVTVTVTADGDVLNFFPLPDSVSRDYQARMEVDAPSSAGCDIP